MKVFCINILTRALRQTYTFFLISVILLFCLSTVVEAQTETVTLLAFGDSITQGFKRKGSVTWGIKTPPHGARVGGYEPHLEDEFAENELTQNIPAYVHNWGYGGERTTSGVSRLKTILSYYGSIYDYCLLMEGANDLYGGISPKTTAFNMGIMVDACRSSNATPILATITKNTNTYYGYRIYTDYNPEIIKVADQKNVILADQYGAVNPTWLQLTSGDGLHLNDTGDQVMAKTWYEALIQDERFIPAPVLLTGPYLLLLKK